MIRLHQLSVAPNLQSEFDSGKLKSLCAERLKLPEAEIACVQIVKRSVDARHGEAWIVYTVDVSLKNAKKEAQAAARFRPNEAAYLPSRAGEPIPSLFEKKLPPWGQGEPRPIVVGAGPAGLFCALALACRGAKPLLLERGKPVEERSLDIALLETQGLLNEESNILFGEGGAGAYSDGKLTCGLNSPLIQTVLASFVACGAPEEILIAAKPHIGTDKLREVLKNLRKRITELGGEIRFECLVSDFILRGGRLDAIRTLCKGKQEEFPVGKLYLAIGHSARDTYRRLYECGIPMVQKPFAMGVRIEHLQRDISKAQYGKMMEYLPPADYKLNVHTPDERGVYTFCMCPGGRVINASGEQDGINVNGMSLHARDGRNANAALLVGVREKDFGSDAPLAGIELQRSIEQAAYRATGSLKAPCIRVGDFLARKKSTSFGRIQPSYLPGVAMTELDGILPSFITENLRYALPLLGKKLRGFDDPDALLTGPETRSSSPVRILRGEDLQSAVKGLYPLGEGAGYAGGIVSAAVDGLRAALES